MHAALARPRRRLAPTLVFALLALAGAPPVRAGLWNWFGLGQRRPRAEPQEAQARVSQYLTELLQRPGFQVSRGRSEMTREDRKALDSHFLSRLERTPEMVIASLAAPAARATGFAVVAGPGVVRSGVDPVRGYLGFVVMFTDAPFPAEADRALSLAAHVLGEPALFGFAPEAGPLWPELEPYLSRNGAFPGEGVAQFAGGASGTAPGTDEPRVAPYRAVSGERSPGSDEVPAWVVRGATEMNWRRHAKPLEMGVMLVLLRRPGAPKGTQIIHVTGVGKLSRGLFKDAIRHSKKTDDE
jgi:hypothetical protein